MSIKYTKHAGDKLKRPDVKKFKVTRKLVGLILRDQKTVSRTKYGDLAKVFSLTASHDLRIVYVIIGSEFKVITFHVCRKGRYR
jgi:hypothetical protein